MTTPSQAEANRQHFDKHAHEMDSTPWQQKIAAQVIQEVRSNLALLGLDSSGKSQTRLLDYACGTGLLSRALAPYIGYIRAIDISSSMVQRYNDGAEKDPELARCKAVAVTGDLCTEEAPAEPLATADLFDFDLAVVGMGFHHFEHLTLSVSRLAERLRPGGKLLIIDLVDDHHGAQSFPAVAKHMVKVHGFSETSMNKIFEDAGLQSCTFKVVEDPVEMVFDDRTIVRNIFLATADKPGLA